MVGWFPREEVALLVGALAAFGCLALGILEVLWPAGVRRPSRPRVALAGRAAAPVSPPAPFARRPLADRLIALVDRACAETDPERRTSALRIAVLTLERWRASGAAPDAPVGRALERARAELWSDYQQLTLRRLAAAPPWRATALRAADGGR